MTIQAVLVYYFALWLANTAAYFVVAIGLRRWLQFLDGLDSERGLRLTMKATFAYGCLRAAFGLTGLTLYLTGATEPIPTILILGVSSLALNTSFILGMGWIFNREAKMLMGLPSDTQRALRIELGEFDDLRRNARLTFAGLRDAVDRVH